MAGRTGVVQLSTARLRAARIAARLTQAQLADRLGSTQSVISAWERGTRRPDVHQLVRLAAALGVDDVLTLLQPGTTHTLEVLRIRAGLTQAELAAKLGLSRSGWAAIERGEQPVQPDDAGLIAEALGASVAQVLTAGSADSVREVVELPDDVMARLDAQRRPGESLMAVLRRLLPDPSTDD